MTSTADGSTCFFDLDGQQGLLGQVQGRTVGDAASWLAGATPAWRDAIRVVCIDLCSIYASAVRRMLPRAVLTADLFHVVRLHPCERQVRDRLFAFYDWCAPARRHP